MNVKKILLADDDEALVKSFSSILREEGYHVEGVKSGKDALNKARKTKFDLAILDIKLPDIMGDKVAKTLKERDGEIIVILITGYPSFQESIDALDIGIYDILLKPIGPDELLRVTGEALSSEVSVSLLEDLVHSVNEGAAYEQ